MILQQLVDLSLFACGVAIALQMVVISIILGRVSRLADRLERLEDHIHDETCHPADRVGTAQRQRADGISRYIVSGFDIDRRGRL
jgi:hypothetical protein